MEVILKKNVDKLGYKDETVNVKPGYGRNFLIPQGYATLATASAKKAHAEVMKQKSHKETAILPGLFKMLLKRLCLKWPVIFMSSQGLIIYVWPVEWH